MHVGKPAAIGVERDPRAAGPAGRPGDAGGGVMPGDEGAGLDAWHKAQIFEAVDRQMREAWPWQRTGGVVDHQMVDVVVRDAGLGEGLGAGDAEGARGGDDYSVAPAKAGVQGGPLKPLRSWIPAFA